MFVIKKLVLFLALAVFGVGIVKAEDGGAAIRIKQLREENKAKIQQIRDLKKQEIVRKIDLNLCRIKKNRANSMMRQIANLTKFVERIEASGKADATKLAEVKVALADAKAAVEALASENCGVQITVATSSAVVGQQVKESVADAKGEWKAAFDKIEAVKKLLRGLITTTKVK